MTDMETTKRIKIIVNSTPTKHETLVIRLTVDASAVVSEISSKTGLSIGYIASQIIQQSADMIDIVNGDDD